MPKIVSIRPIGKHQTYDLEVDHPDHQFYLANGLLTSNSHSDAYSVVTMQTAYLATYHPLEFYAAALTKAQANAIQTLVADIQKTGTKILPVDINKSYPDNRIEGNAIRLSLGRVQGVGPAVAERIMARRREFGEFRSLQDVLDAKLGKTAVEALILVGALSSLPLCENMRRVEAVFAKWTENGKVVAVNDKGVSKEVRVQSVSGKASWYALRDTILTDEGIPDRGLDEKVMLENLLMDFSLAGSPFEILDRKKKIDSLFDGVAKSYNEFIESDLDVAMLPVVVKSFKEKPQRNGKMFAFVKFATEDGVEFESPAFANVWEHIKGSIFSGKVYLVTFNRKEDDPESLVIGKPGWAQSKHSVRQAFIDVDEIKI